MKIVIGSEHAGMDYRLRLCEALRAAGDEVISIGENDQLCGYPAVAQETCSRVLSGEADFGILICGTGIGMCMAAGKVPGIRAALCTDSYMASMAKKHNNANVIVFGSRVIGFEEMLFVLDSFRKESYEGGRHDARLQALAELESTYLK